jgi:serine/threonine protein kinase
VRAVLASTGWLDVRRQVGEGSFGLVYEAYDRRRKIRVAVKVPRSLDGAALYSFKREFRALADVHHTNLVTLYDLVADAEDWFFSMEFIDGVNLLEHVRPGQADGAVLPPASFGALRVAFAQVASGVQALHAAMILHRDLKPSNVLVAPDGRVVLVDFGFVKELRPADASASMGITGSPLYMAPEQLAGEQPSPAGDWYSVGVMLYEALTGRPPFRGSALEVFDAKRRGEPPPPHAMVPEVPRDLSVLCQHMLRRDPAERVAGAEILRRLAASPPAYARPALMSTERRPALVGRVPHLHVLADAFAQSLRGHSVTVHVQGRSGMGKTALVQSFVQDLRVREPSAVVLLGRCYERESVPYKALDSLVDDLSRHLSRLSSVEAARVLPRDVQALARSFPVLGGVPAVATTRHRTVDVPSAQELRRRATTALRELLARIADERPLVLVIDDLQWGDVDSGAVLSELLRPPDPPPLLLVLCYRSEDADKSPLPRLLHAPADAWAGNEQVQLEVSELSPDEARALAASLLAEYGAATAGRADAIAADSGGSPYFLTELARHAAGPRPLTVGEPTFDAMIQSRVTAFPVDVRQLLEIVAVAGGPLLLRVAQAAAGLHGEEAPAVRLLRSERLVRTRQTEQGDEVETYHDRIREAVVHELPAASTEDHHRRLAEAWENAGGGDPETLATHWECAGVKERAARYALQAADQSAEALAFERAARLYRRSLLLSPPADPWEERTLRVRLGDALANAGRGAAAAEAYLAAVDAGTPDGEGLELRRRAAQQLLITGHHDEGLEVLRQVLHAVGMRLARTPGRALVLFVLRRAQLALRGLGYRPARADALSQQQVRRIDTCWAAVTGLSMVDTIRSAHLQVRHLLLALETGEPYRLARALALSAGHSVTRGRRTWQRTERLMRLAETLAEEIAHPHARGLCLTIRGAVASFQGRFREALDLARAGEDLLSSKCTGVTWEVDTATIFELHSLYWMGDWSELTRRLPPLLLATEDRGDLYLGTYLGTRSLYMALLAADDHEEAERRQGQSLAAWSRQGFQVQHYFDWLARCEIDLYAGRGAAAWRRVRDGWRRFRSSHLDANQAIYVESRFLRARAALAAAAESGTPSTSALVRRAERDAAGIEREGVAWGAALARLVRAGVAAAQGQLAGAGHLAGIAAAEFDALDMAHFAAAARRRRGQVLGGRDGAALAAAADERLRERGARSPERMTALLAPGTWHGTAAPARLHPGRELH